LREFLEDLSSPLPYAPPLFLSSSWLRSHVWSCASELEDTPHTGHRRAVGSLVQRFLLPLLCWTGSGRSHGAPYVCEYYEVIALVLLRWHHGAVALCGCCHTGIMVPWHRSIVTSRSSRPLGRLCHLHRQRLCGSIIPAFSLVGYRSESLLIVIALLDR
jgi:hypothetical protein